MKWKILFLGLLILILISGCTTNNSPEIDQELEKAIKDLKEGKTVKISAIVKDDSGLDVSIAKTDAEKSEIIEKITLYREEKASKILSDVQNNKDISIISSVYGIIRFEVTKKGFDILSKDSRISYMELAIEDSDEFLQQCQTDGECISVSEHSCGCGIIGSAKSINTKYEEYWEEKLIETTLDLEILVCPAVLPNNPECFKAPRCLNNKCTLVEFVQRIEPKVHEELEKNHSAVVMIFYRTEKESGISKGELSIEDAIIRQMTVESNEFKIIEKNENYFIAEITENDIKIMQENPLLKQLIKEIKLMEG